MVDNGDPEKQEPDFVEHAENVALPTEKDHAQLLHQSKIATQSEHQITSWKALKVYKKAVFWSIIVSMGIIMDSYDGQLLGNFYALPEFQKQFGKQIGVGKYSVTTHWQEVLSMCGYVGEQIRKPILNL